MVDSHETLESRIYVLAKKDATPVYSMPTQPWWSIRQTKAIKTELPAPNGGKGIEVGYGGNKRLGRIASRGEHVYWISDSSVEPPVTYVLKDSFMGASATEGNALGDSSESFDNVFNERGSAIVARMQELLNRFAPVTTVSTEDVRLDPSLATVPGLGV